MKWIMFINSIDFYFLLYLYVLLVVFWAEYEEVAKIPQGAVNIFITEKVASWNYLGEFRRRSNLF